jgi:hypothetical protein
MSLRQKVRLELEDGTEILTEYNGVDHRAWEKVNQGKSSLREPIDLTRLTWLGWNAAKRRGLINGAYDSFEDFDAVCADVGWVGDEEPVPTVPAKKAGTRKARGPASSAP